MEKLSRYCAPVDGLTGCPRICEMLNFSGIDDTSKTVCGKYPVIGTTHTVNRYLDADMFVAIGDATIRKNMVRCLETLGIHIPVMVHPQCDNWRRCVC